MKIAYLKFTFETGCRRSETMQIRKDIINAKPKIKSKTVKNEDGIEEVKEIKYYLTPKVRCKGHGKTGNVRPLKFSDYSMDAFKKWLEVRGEDDCEYMFVTKYEGEIKQVARTTFNLWSKGVFTKLLGRRFHPHILREARATSIVVEEGRNIETAQKLLGHKDSTTTRIYVIKDDDDEESDELFME
jgi:integrase